MKNLFIVVVLTMVFFTCDNRTGLINPRNNPYDSGGNNFSISGLPTVTGRTDSTWYNYDFDTRTGSIRFTYTIDDPNFPNDTVQCRFLLHDDTIATNYHMVKSDSFIVVSNLSPATTYSCNVLATDQFDSSTAEVFEITTPHLLPPHAPIPRLTNSDNPIIITWDTVTSAKEYTVYGSDEKYGPYDIDTVIEQPEDASSITFSRNFNENDSRYYIISARNAGGENHSRDTLYARRYSNDIPVPKIDSVSKGTYSDFIRVMWRPADSTITTYALYRSESSDGTYALIATVKQDTLTYLYNDSVAAPIIYYYKIAAIDSENKSSKLSEPRSGYIHFNSQLINLTVKGNKEFIELYWTPIPDVHHYLIYRSSTSCQTNLELIDSTPEFNYFDTVHSAITFSYTVFGIDSTGQEIAKSDCKSGSLGQLPAPSGIQIINTVTSSELRWNSVSGAIKYIVYRFLDSCHATINENYIFAIVPTTIFKDTNNISQYRYYKLAAVDDAGRIGIPSNCYIGSSDILSSVTGFDVSQGTYPTAITLKWNALKGAKSYIIYRSATSCSDQKKLVSIDSTTYTDTVPTSSSYYYSISGVDIAQTEGSRSECREGRVKLLPAPANLVSSYNLYIKHITLSWNPISDPVLGYIIYRGTTALETGMAPICTLTAVTYIDSVKNSTIYYYRVAAYNKLGAGTLSQFTTGRTLIPPTLSIYNDVENIQVSWMFSKTYKMVYINRSTDSLTFNRIDSIDAGNYYLDTPSDYHRYYYRVDIRMETGETVQSNIVAGYKNIAAPKNLKAIDYEDRVDLTWDTVSGAQSYIVHRRISSYGDDDFTKEITAASFSDTSISMKRYYYYVTAKNGNGVSAPSSQVQAGILQTPGVPSVYLSGAVDGIEIHLTASSSGSMPNGYQIYRSSTYDGPYSLIDSTHNNYYFDTVPDFNPFYYRVTAYNNGGTSVLSNPEKSQRTLPTPPLGVRASNGISTKFIRVTWYPSQKSITSYTIYRRNSASGTYEKIGSTSDTIFYDSTIGEIFSTIYYYVTASIDTVESRPSSTAYGNLFGPPTSIGVSSTLFGIGLSWTNRSNVEKYYIYRSNITDGTFTLIDSSSSSNYTDTNELSGNNYYRVAAVSSINGEVSVQSKSSAAATRTYPNAPTSIIPSTGTDSAVVKVVWSSATGAIGYKLFRSTADSFTVNNAILIKEVDTTVYYDTVPSDSAYYYRLKAYNKGGESSLSLTSGRGYRIPRIVPAKPIEFDTLYASGKIHLQWKMPSRTIAYGGFKIYRSENDTAFTLIESISDYTQTYYIDNPPKSSPTVYYYKVSAYNDKGESIHTDSVSGTRY